MNVIDTAGPWEVFCDTAIYGGRGQFDLYTVAASTSPVEGNSGLEITPRYTYDNAPQPHVVVIPAHDRVAHDHRVAPARREARRPAHVRLHRRLHPRRRPGCWTARPRRPITSRRTTSRHVPGDPARTRAALRRARARRHGRGPHVGDRPCPASRPAIPRSSGSPRDHAYLKYSGPIHLGLGYRLRPASGGQDRPHDDEREADDHPGGDVLRSGRRRRRPWPRLDSRR